jgi:4-amino-4-deoxy-L-arabinose transferase-like glycosyltransferase
MISRNFRRFGVATAGIVLLTAVIRLPLLVYPRALDDENMYSLVANEIVDGGRPYVDAVDRKPPLLFWTYAAVFELGGKFNWKALHAVAFVWTLLTMVGLYAIGAELFERETGLVAALLYSVFQPWAFFDDLAFNGELLMNLPIVWAWAIAFRRSSSLIRPELLASGALLGAAFLLKQPAAIAAVPLGIYLLLPSYRSSRDISSAASITHAAVLTLGFIATLTFVTVILWKQCILRDAFYWTITDHTIPHVFLTTGFLRTLLFVALCLPLVLGAAMGTRHNLIPWAGKSAEKIALLGLLIASAIGVCAGGRFYPHYYIQLIPPLALLAAPVYVRVWSRKTRSPLALLRPDGSYVWLAVIVIAFSINHWRERVGPTEAGLYLSEHSAPDDRIFVWGQESSIYLDARRRPACRYIATFPLTGYVFGGWVPGDTRSRALPGAWATLEHDFAIHPPTYIVDTQSEPGDRYPVQDFPILAKLLTNKYQRVAHNGDGVIYRLR